MSIETVVDHISEDECVLRSREAPPLVDALQQSPVHHPTIYPVIDTWLTGNAAGYCGDPQPSPAQRVWHRLPSCCFHDLFSATDGELAGMAICIVGNICKAVAEKRLSSQADARLELKLSPSATPMALPWPAMPSTQPLPLDLTDLPFDFEMMLDTDTKEFKKRVDRLALMRRCERDWVPYLKSVLQAKL